MRKFLLLPALLGTFAAAQAAGEFYCCPEPGTGRRICGDTLPPQCRGQSYRVLDSLGNLVKEVGPPLTPEQKAELTLEKARQKRLEEAAREQRRRDQALLDTYATPEDIDLAQKKAEADINVAILATIARIDAAYAKRKKLDVEAEFYKKTPMPAELAKQIEAINHEIGLQQNLMTLKQRDFDTVRTKYDADRKRYFELTGKTSKESQPPGAAPSPTPRPR